MESKIVSWIEKYLYAPSFFQKSLSFFLYPLSLLYCFIATKRALKEKKSFNVPIISVGNLIVGGSGKTPFIIELAKRYENAFVILRGYKRKRQGLVEVSKKGKILVDVEASGDEAMLIAKNTKASVIVSKDREEAIRLAIKEGASVILLDDGFAKPFEKFDILIDVDTPNSFCLPAGPYRLPKRFLKRANLVIKENRDFKREVSIKNPTSKMLFLTAIANPKRVFNYLPKGIEKITFLDHHYFTLQELQKIWNEKSPTSFLVTSKDLVKLETFPFPYSLLELRLDINPEVLREIDHYIKEFNAKKDPNSSNTP